MKQSTIWMGLFLTFALSSAHAERKALVIGNADYQVRPLKNPLNDVSAMQKKLGDLGFTVTAKKNLSRAQIRQQVRDFAKQLTAEDEALFYFSGHGAQVEGQNYLIPLGNDIQSEDEVSDDAVSLNFVLNKLTNSSARLNIVILDACRDNPFQGSTKSSTRGLARLKRRIKGTIVAFAASAGGVSQDGDRRNGTYTEVLLKHLATPNITLNQMFNRVRADVNQATGGKQFPIEENGLLRDVYLVKTQSPEPVVIVSTPEPVVRQSFEPEMVSIPAGSFQMGCVSGKDCYDSEKPVHKVTIAAFQLATTEVTFAQWDACVEAKGCSHNPDDNGWGRGNRPVINVSWDDAQQYIKWLKKETGKEYRLPTEAEWEYAARAGTKTAYSWGNEIHCSRANYGYVSSECETNQTKPVASYSANTWGLYDMHGNVWEWVTDPWHKNYQDAPTDGSARTGKGTHRVLRSGSWDYGSRYLRLARRSGNLPDSSFNDIGLRLALGQPSSS